MLEEAKAFTCCPYAYSLANRLSYQNYFPILPKSVTSRSSEGGPAVEVLSLFFDVQTN